MFFKFATLLPYPKLDQQPPTSSGFSEKGFKILNLFFNESLCHHLLNSILFNNIIGIAIQASKAAGKT